MYSGQPGTRWAGDRQLALWVAAHIPHTGQAFLSGTGHHHRPMTESSDKDDSTPEHNRSIDKDAALLHNRSTDKDDSAFARNRSTNQNNSACAHNRSRDKDDNALAQCALKKHIKGWQCYWAQQKHRSGWQCSCAQYSRNTDKDNSDYALYNSRHFHLPFSGIVFFSFPPTLFWHYLDCLHF